MLYVISSDGIPEFLDTNSVTGITQVVLFQLHIGSWSRCLLPIVNEIIVVQASGSDILSLPLIAIDVNVICKSLGQISYNIYTNYSSCPL